MSSGKKKNKPGGKGRPRNPFAGRPKSGAGPHGEKKYSKKNRRRSRKELEEQDKEEDS